MALTSSFEDKLLGVSLDSELRRITQQVFVKKPVKKGIICRDLQNKDIIELLSAIMGKFSKSTECYHKTSEHTMCFSEEFLKL